MKNHHFPPEANMEPKEKGKILFAYTKQIIADIKNDVFSFRCCSKQFCRKELFEQHRNVVHPFVIKKTWTTYYLWEQSSSTTSWRGKNSTTLLGTTLIVTIVLQLTFQLSSSSSQQKWPVYYNILAEKMCQSPYNDESYWRWPAGTDPGAGPWQ